MSSFILGVPFAHRLPVKSALESFYAIGRQKSSRILAKHSIHPTARVGSLPAKTVTALTAELSLMKIETDARRVVKDNIRRLYDLGTYKGKRHALGLPVNGQRTRNQIKTAQKLNKLDRRG